MAGDQRDRALGERAPSSGAGTCRRSGAPRAGRRSRRRSAAPPSPSPRPGVRPWRRTSVSIVRFRSWESELPSPIGTSEHPRLLAELLDRVDLAVVPEDAEGLDPGEGGPGVGRVAVVAEAADRLEALVGEVGVVATRAPSGRPSPCRRRSVPEKEATWTPSFSSSSTFRLKRVRSASAASGTRPANCQNCGSSSRAVGPSAAESTAPTRSARIRKPAAPRISRASWRTFSRSCERSTKTWATAKASSRASEGLWPPCADLLGPDLGRDVDQQAAAVALAVDVAGAVEHLLERLERQGHRLVARRRVAPHRGVDRAGVLVLHARGRDARAVGALGREALTLLGTSSSIDLRFRAFFERARDGVGPTERGIIGGPHSAPSRFSRRFCPVLPQFAKARLARFRPLQRYFQPGERFYIVFSERSQTCYN